MGMSPQQDAFDALKVLLNNSPTLSLYDPKKDTKLSADASSFGLEGVLLQRHEGNEWLPVAYASRSMSATQQRYAKIEKEGLATTWACERFSDYLIGETIPH